VNRAIAAVDIDLSSGAVSLGERLLAAEPIQEVPLSRRYLLR
jgi:urease alpha subunit